MSAILLLEPMRPTTRRPFHRIWAIIAVTLTVLLFGLTGWRLFVYSGPFWTEDWSAILIGLAPLMLVTLTLSLVSHRTEATVSVTQNQLEGAKTQLVSSCRSTGQLRLQLWTNSDRVDLADPRHGMLRSTPELHELSEMLRRAGDTAIAEKVAELARRGVLTLLRPDTPAATRTMFRPLRLLSSGFRLYLSLAILLGLPYYLFTKAQRTDGEPSAEQLLAWAGVAMFFGLAAVYILAQASIDLVAVLRRNPRLSVAAAAGYRISVRSGVKAGARFAPHRRARPVLLVVPAHGRIRWYDLADPATGALLPTARLREIADFVAAKGTGSAATVAQLRELAQWQQERGGLTWAG